MSAKGTLPEADLLGGPALSARSAKLAQLFVEWTSQRPLKIIVAFVILTFVSGLYVVRHFSINTDVNALISADLPWRQRELAYESAFPQSTQGILAVVDAPTSELAGAPPQPRWPISCPNTMGFSARSRNSAGESFLRAIRCCSSTCRSSQAF
jgi:hypothetical protein